MRKGNNCSLKVRSVYLFVILKMPKITDFFNHIVMKLLLEEMLNLMKISWPETNSSFVPSSTYNPSSTFVPYFVPILVSSSSNDVCEDKNPHLPTHLPPNESIDPKPTPAPLLPIWVHSTQEAVGDLVGDSSN
jgi:hypothetical protein